MLEIGLVLNSCYDASGFVQLRSIHCTQHNQNGRSSRAASALQMVAKGDVATIELKVTLDDGAQFDSTFDQGEVSFVVGDGGYLPAIHKALLTLQPGDKTSFTIAPKNAFGEYNKDLVLTRPIEEAPAGIQAGQAVKLWTGQKARVTSVTPEDFTLDVNPPNAGKALNVDVKVLSSKPKAELEVAEFALGCFWGGELAFQRASGVVGTKVGYTQGKKAHPSYNEVCAGTTGHAEAIQVVFDPSVTSFEALLEIFWRRHDPTQKNKQGNDEGTQYRGGVYYHSEKQKELFEASLIEEQKRYGAPIKTECLPATTFYDAEEYHQQYLEKGGQVAKKGYEETIRCYG